MGVVAHVGELEIVSGSSPGGPVDRRICQVAFRLRDAECVLTSFSGIMD